MRKVRFAPGEYYHIYNRENNKKNIYFKDRDYARFLFYALFFQAPVTIYNSNKAVQQFLKRGKFNLSSKTINKVIENRYVELICFALMPNHFHLLIKEKEEGGISRYMQRILNGYTKYFNAKYDKLGHLFQGPFKAVHIKDNRQILHLSSYIHKNPKELKGWGTKLDQYPWSSYQDFTGNNRWEDLLVPKIILEQFSNQREYEHFINTSSAKQLTKHSVFS